MSSFLDRLGHAALAMLAVAVLAVVVWFAAQAALVFAGVTAESAMTAASASAIALALVVSDVYLPIGGGPRTDVLRNRPPVENVRDALLVGLLGGVVGFALALAGIDGWLGVGGGAFVGYLAFVVRYREEYAIRPEE